jgi:hypothetical protein
MSTVYKNIISVCFPELPILSVLLASLWLAQRFPL